jgi:hypothetical protein
MPSATADIAFLARKLLKMQHNSITEKEKID